MKPSIEAKLAQLSARLEEINRLLANEKATADMDSYRRLTREHAELEPVVELYQARRQGQHDLEAAQQMAAEPEMKDFAEDEIKAARERIARLEGELQVKLLPRDPNDERNTFLEIRAGTGGDESALFAADLFRMYSRYAEDKRWSVEILSANETGIGGFKEIIAGIKGKGAYSRLKYESGVHRVQRVPATEASGRIHTSAVTVAVLPEAEEVEVEIDQNDLRIDTFRASGAGGQHVNKTESAIRITHIPTGIVVSCQDEKSQHKNKAKALRVIRTRILQKMQDDQAREIASQRRSQVGTGDRSERIRTYNFPQGRVTDHRVNLTLHKLPQILEGDIDAIIDELTAHYQAEALKKTGS
jgi:peptide chain release factor 1